MAATGPAPQREDGRKLRAERSRTAVVDAMLSLYEDGVIEPAAADIAERAGVSERSVFRLFSDLEALAAEVIDRQYGRVETWFEPPAVDGDRAARVAAFVDHRTRLYERMANLARMAAFAARRSPTIEAAVAWRRSVLRDQVAEQFAEELDAAGGPRERRLLLARLDGAASFEALDYHRTFGEVGPRDLKVVLTTTLDALLTAAVPTTRSSA